MIDSRQLFQLFPTEADIPAAHRLSGPLHQRCAPVTLGSIPQGDIAGAAHDVFEHELAVSPKRMRLARAGKVVLLPHMGSATIEGRVEMGEKVIINIRTFLDGHKPPDRVLPGML